MKPLIIIFLLFATVSAKAQQRANIHLLPEKQRDSILLRIANDQFMSIYYPGYVESRDKPAAVVDLGANYDSGYQGIPIMQVNYLYSAEEQALVGHNILDGSNPIFEIKIRTDTGQVIGYMNNWIGLGTLCDPDDDPKSVFPTILYSHDQFIAYLNELKSKPSPNRTIIHPLPEDSWQAQFYREYEIRQKKIVKLRAAYIQDSIQRRLMGR